MAGQMTRSILGKAVDCWRFLNGRVPHEQHTLCATSKCQHRIISTDYRCGSSGASLNQDGEEHTRHSQPLTTVGESRVASLHQALVIKHQCVLAIHDDCEIELRRTSREPGPEGMDFFGSWPLGFNIWEPEPRGGKQMSHATCGVIFFG
jgi:hypothetical protein